MKITTAQQWMIVYSNIVSKAWEDTRLTEALLNHDNQSELKQLIHEKFNFEFPAHVNVYFELAKNHNSFPQYGENDFDIFANNVESSHTYALLEAPQNLLMIHENFNKHVSVSTMCCCLCM